MASSRRPAAFLDRDGTIIEDRDYLADPAAVRLLPGAAEAIVELNRAGWPVVVVTNQSGIGRGLLSEMDYAQVRQRLDQILQAAGAKVLATYHCPHDPNEPPACDCRKPAPGLYRRAAAEHHLDLGRSVYVGDRVRDILAGLDLGGTGYLLPGHEEEEVSPPEGRWYRVGSLAEAVEHFLRVGGDPALIDA